MSEEKQENIYKRIVAEIEVELDVLVEKIAAVLENDTPNNVPKEEYEVELLTDLNRVKGRIANLNARIRL